MIPFSDLSIWLKDGHLTGEVIFTHVDDHTGEAMHFAIDRLNKYINERGAERIRAGIDMEFAATMPVRRGLEQHRLDRITVEDILVYPILLAHIPEREEHLIIDGSHRYFKASTMGWPEIPAYVLEPDVWRNFLIDFPPDINAFAKQQIK